MQDTPPTFFFSSMAYCKDEQVSSKVRCVTLGMNRARDNLVMLVGRNTSAASQDVTTDEKTEMGHATEKVEVK